MKTGITTTESCTKADNINHWIDINLSELSLICNKITRSDTINDLLHCCIEQFLKNKRVPDLCDNEKLYFFARIVRNNYQSRSSQFYRQYKKHSYEEFKDIDIPDEEYVEPQINIDWVHNQITKDKRGENWYFARLFEIYIEEGCSIKNTAKRTTIPPNSVSRDINRYRTELKIKRNIFIRNN